MTAARVAEALRSRPRIVAHVVLAAVCYLPLLFTRPGLVLDDTKTYLYLDPADLMDSARSMWDPGWGLGTVTHQTIGYLFPTGPWFWFFETIGVPDWVAHRLWVSTTLFAAGAGLLFLGRVFGWSTRSSLIAALVYVLSPYPLSYVGRITVLIAPWAGLPWMVGLGIRAVRRGGWVDVAWLGVVTTLVGAINGSSLVYAGVAVIAWMPFAVLVNREATWRQVAATTGRIAVVLTPLSAWWLAGLWVQGSYGPDVLRFTETLDVVGSASPASEAWRGLGYWVFYGGDQVGPWVSAAVDHTQRPWLIAAGFAMAVVMVAALALVRWRYRAYMLTLALLGVVLTVGFHPFDAPGTMLGWFRDDIVGTDAVLALRSSPRALPLYLLAGACAIAVGLDHLRVPWSRLARTAGLVVLALAVAGIPSLWTGRYLGTELARDEELPEYWQQAAASLDAGDHNSRVLVIPGTDFAAHRWGNTIDPVLPGLTDRPMAVRELVGYGTPPSEDLLIALDRRLQEGILEPEALGPIARLLGTGEVLAQLDLEYERFRTPRPDALWAVLDSGPAGLGEPRTYGPPTPNVAGGEVPLIDALELEIPPDLPVPPPVATLAVEDPLGIVHTRPVEAPLVVAGNGDALVEMAAAGLLDPEAVVLYEASLTSDELDHAVEAGAHLVLTDQNRQRAQRWKAVRDMHGMTESVHGDGLEPDPTDARIELFGDAAPDSFTMTRHLGVEVRGSAYGNPVRYAPEQRPVAAIDGDPTTAWRIGDWTDARGEWIELTFAEPVDMSSLRLVQPDWDRNRDITDIVVSVDGEPLEPFVLDAGSVGGDGQTLDLGARTGRVMRIEIRETTAGRRPGYTGLTPVGFAEIAVGAGAPVTATEVVMAPRSLARRTAGSDLAASRFTVVLSRERVETTSVVRSDPERAMIREVSLPEARTFDISGTARISGWAEDSVIAEVLGLSGTARVTATEHLSGSVDGHGSVILDGQADTIWRSPIHRPAPQTLTVELGSMRRIAGFELDVLADGRHSVPTRLVVTGGGHRREVDLDPVLDGVEGHQQTLTVELDEPIEAETLQIEIAEVRRVRSPEYFSRVELDMPVGVAELRIPGVEPARLPAVIDSGCRDDLLEVDGTPVGVRITGSGDAGLAGLGLELEGCGLPLDLAEGSHVISAAAGRETGIDIDRLVLDSAADSPVARLSAPSFDLVEAGPTSVTVEVDPTSDPFWLVMGQSFSDGWEARVVGGESLGSPRLVDGYASGWLVTAETAGSIRLTMEFAPDATVRAAIWLSVLAGVVTVGLLLGGRRRPIGPLPLGSALPWDPRVSRRVVLARPLGGPVPQVLADCVRGVGAQGGEDPRVGQARVVIDLERRRELGVGVVAARSAEILQCWCDHPGQPHLLQRLGDGHAAVIVIPHHAHAVEQAFVGADLGECPDVRRGQRGLEPVEQVLHHVALEVARPEQAPERGHRQVHMGVDEGRGDDLIPQIHRALGGRRRVDPGDPAALDLDPRRCHAQRLVPAPQDHPLRRHCEPRHRDQDLPRYERGGRHVDAHMKRMLWTCVAGGPPARARLRSAGGAAPSRGGTRDQDRRPAASGRRRSPGPHPRRSDRPAGPAPPKGRRTPRSRSWCGATSSAPTAARSWARSRRSSPPTRTTSASCSSSCRCPCTRTPRWRRRPPWPRSARGSSGRCTTRCSSSRAGCARASSPRWRPRSASTSTASRRT